MAWNHIVFYILASALVLFFSVEIARGAPVPLFYRVLPRKIIRISPDNGNFVQQCGFSGNPDFYGLGIRIAIYLQWLTSFAANHLLSERDVKGYLATNTIFLIAVFVALAMATWEKSIRSAEILVLLQLAFGFLFSVLSIWGYRTTSRLKEPIRFPLMGSFFRLILATAICSYSVWFWFTGLHSVDDGSCPSSIFLFAKANIRSGVRFLFEIQSVVLLAAYAILLVWEFLLVIAFSVDSAIIGVFVGILCAVLRDRKKYSRVAAFGILIKQTFRTMVMMVWYLTNEKGTSGYNRPELVMPLLFAVNSGIFLCGSLTQYVCLFLFKIPLPIGFPPMLSLPQEDPRKPPEDKTERAISWTDKVLNQNPVQWAIRCTNIVALVWAVVSIEFTIIWNSISGVSGAQSLKSTGQLIPLITSILGLLQLTHNISVRRSGAQFTDILVGILDNGHLIPKESRAESNHLKSDGVNEGDPRVSEDKFFETPFATYITINNKSEAVFYKLHPNRCESAYTLYPLAIRHKQQRELREPYMDVSSQPYLTNLPFPESYGADNISIYSLKDGGKAFFVKDFRNRGVPESHHYYGHSVGQNASPLKGAELTVQQSPSLTFPRASQRHARRRDAGYYTDESSSRYSVASQHSSSSSSLPRSRHFLRKDLAWFHYPLVLCIMCIFYTVKCLLRLLPLSFRKRMSALMKIRMQFATKEFGKRFGSHVDNWLKKQKQRSTSENKKTTERTEENTATKSSKPPPRSTSKPNSRHRVHVEDMSHRQKVPWMTSRDREAVKLEWKERSLYRAIIIAAEPLALRLEQYQFPMTASVLRNFAAAVQFAKETGERCRHGDGELNLEQQHELLFGSVMKLKTDLTDCLYEEFIPWTKMEQVKEMKKGEIEKPEEGDNEEDTNMPSLARSFTWPPSRNELDRKSRLWSKTAVLSEH